MWTSLLACPAGGAGAARRKGADMSEREGMAEPAGQRCDEGDLDAVTGRVLAELLHWSHLMRPDDIPGMLAELAPLGVSEAIVYLADLQQRELASLLAGADRDVDVLPIDSTLAGRAYQTLTVQSARLRGTDAYQVWIPLIDGAERLGVLGLTVADASEAMLARYQTVASLVAIMVMAMASYSDAYAKVQRSRQMALQAELVWSYLDSRTFATDLVLVAATLEPAYEAGGDAFDYSLLGDHLHASVYDALGHDLAAGLLASVAIASCRSTRRSGGSLAAIAAQADDAIASFFGQDRFVTALLCDLDLITGLFTWIPCGHPPPLLIRGNRTVLELERTARPPLGLGRLRARPSSRSGGAAAPAVSHTERLEPGDRVLLYTDGVTEGRAADGTPFGLQRFADFIIRHSSADLPAPETMRRLNHAILDYQHGRLRDDATAVLIEWQPEHPGRNPI
jgi:serine phosphatase RsbU (regulator of sigma subunit)